MTDEKDDKEINPDIVKRIIYKTLWMENKALRRGDLNTTQMVSDLIKVVEENVNAN